MTPQPLNFAINRRAFLGYTAGGLGCLALSHLLGAEAQAKEAFHPLAPKVPHHPAKAKAVICLFQHGGPSQMDLFDPKPELNKWNGKEYPHKDLEIHFEKQAGKNLQSPFFFPPGGPSGVAVFGFVTPTPRISDPLSPIRSMNTAS